MRYRLQVVYLFSISLFSTSYQASELVFSHSGHPVNESVLIPLLQTWYNELGYTLSLQEAEGARAVKLLNDGLIDGDVARLSPLLQYLDPPAEAILLDTVQIVIYCRDGVPCHADLVSDRKVQILVPTQDTTLKLLTSDIAAKLYFNNNWQQVITLFNAGKIDYLLWPQSRLLPPPDILTKHYAITRIGPFKLFHILHPKHHALAQAVRQKANAYVSSMTDTIKQ
ncbi:MULTISPECIES: hypothetical protein [Rheinheimera]|jgi:hypothetical protein|uniref:hypothetical protein n=1 Tax=Rheinheimera TaxID=67575 RepID=UPI00106685DC|nr:MULTISPECIES: hypothetical protein [Rheinheimera]|tara:strand:+ start:1612 stop:2286 length:675 start_codon:yes stop_codon:yes gene_type:complete